MTWHECQLAECPLHRLSRLLIGGAQDERLDDTHHGARV